MGSSLRCAYCGKKIEWQDDSVFVNGNVLCSECWKKNNVLEWLRNKKK